MPLQSTKHFKTLTFRLVKGFYGRFTFIEFIDKTGLSKLLADKDREKRKNDLQRLYNTLTNMWCDNGLIKPVGQNKIKGKRGRQYVIYEPLVDIELSWDATDVDLSDNYSFCLRKGIKGRFTFIEFVEETGLYTLMQSDVTGKIRSNVQKLYNAITLIWLEDGFIKEVGFKSIKGRKGRRFVVYEPLVDLNFTLPQLDNGV